MLCELKVENLALIEFLHLSFDRQDETDLVVMTGETGAGKSIMLRALSLLTGRRASSDWIRAGAENCTVEALFEVDENCLAVFNLLEAGGFGTDSTIIIKRVITSKGRSRLYINGSLATARVVSEICFHLLSIASQHDHQQLLQPALHLDFLDTLGDHWELRNDFKLEYQAWQNELEILSSLRAKERDREQQFDFLSFQVREIRSAELVVGEDDELASERKRLKSSDTLIKLGRESYGAFAASITDQLAQVRKNMEQLASIDPKIEKLAEEVSGYAYLAEDFSTQLRDYCEQLENDPIRLEAVNERLDQLQALKRKYGETIEEVLSFAENAERELERIENLDREIEEQYARTQALETKITALAETLSLKRRDAAQKMERAMGSELTTLAFNQAGLEVRFKEQEHTTAGLLATGFDRIEFFFAPNPGEPPRPLVKVASGGELSRLMLALKCLLAKKDMVETVIFDEVDAGIGGEAAEAVARKIKELAGHHQVFCITHLPQIAARGTVHLKVEKEVVNGRTQSTVSTLSEQDRVGELARMLAGTSVTNQTQAWASELLVKGKETG